jgi:hypothetical protein
LLAIYFRAFYGIQIVLVIASGVFGGIVIIMLIQRMNMVEVDYSTDVPSKLVQSILLLMMFLGWVLSISVWRIVHLIKPQLLSSRKVSATIKVSLLSKLMLIVFSFIIGAVISSVLGLFLPIAVFMVAPLLLLAPFFRSYEFLHHINTSSDWKTSDISSSEPIVQWMYSQMDIEQKAWLIDQKSTWTELTPRQIQTKELLFILDYYWGIFMHWGRSTISSSLPKIK